jgi:hypothetical protein
VKTIKLAALCGLVAVIVLTGSGWQTPATTNGASQSFDVCMEDDETKANAVRFNSNTGDYQFCAGGSVTSGKGTVKKMGNTILLEHNDANRKVMARIDTTANKGSATLQTPPGTTRGSVVDENTSDSVCGCR